MVDKKDKWVVQCVIFNAEYFDNKTRVKNWIEKNNFVLQKVKNPIKRYDDCYRVRQKEPKLFKPFNQHHKIKILVRNKVKAIYGILK